MSALVTWDANYGRDGAALIIDGVCVNCGTGGRVLSVDQSEGEYYPLLICQSCIKTLFESKHE